MNVRGRNRAFAGHYATARRDPFTMTAGGALMIAVSLSAGLLAARRATRIDPMVALRQD